MGYLLKVVKSRRWAIILQDRSAKPKAIIAASNSQHILNGKSFWALLSNGFLNREIVIPATLFTRLVKVSFVHSAARWHCWLKEQFWKYLTNANFNYGCALNGASTIPAFMFASIKILWKSFCSVCTTWSQDTAILNATQHCLWWTVNGCPDTIKGRK